MNAIEKAQAGVGETSEKAACRSRARRREALEPSAIASWLLEGRYLTVDARGVVTTWSAGAQEAFGWSRSDIVGAGFADTLLAAPERGAQGAKLAALLEGERAARVDGDMEILTHAGETVATSLAAVPIRVGVGYEFNSLLHEIASSLRSPGSVPQLKQRHASVVALVEDALDGRPAEEESEDARRLAGALIVFERAQQPAPPADNVVPIAEAASSNGRGDRDLDEARVELRALRAELDQARREAQRNRDETDVARQEAADAHQALLAAQRQAAAAEQAVEYARQSAEEVEAAREAARMRLEEASQEATRVRAELVESREEARATVRRLETDLARAREDSERRSQQLDEARSELARLTAELERTRAEGRGGEAHGDVDSRMRLERMEAAFERAPVGAILTAPDGSILEANRVLCDTLGYRRDALVADSPPALVHDDDVDARRELIRRLLRGDQVAARGYRRYIHADGYVITMRESATLLRGRDGEPLMLLFQLEEAGASERVDHLPPDPELVLRDLDDHGPVAGAPSHAALRRAVEDELFVLHCQPVLDLRSNAVSQYELLLRMTAEDGRALLPQVFLEPARRAGLAGAIDRWVVRRACALLAADPGGERSVEVNLSPEAIHDPGLPELLEQELAAPLIDPARLIIEITSHTAVQDLQRSQDLARRLRSLGCRFALDDFRSTFGALRLLKDLPLDYLKLDGELISSLSESRTTQLIVKAIVDVAAATDTRTVAVFVSDERTLNELREHGVDYAQGYCVGRPRPVDEVWGR